ncbi:hypothetical protein MMC30_005388 [Trapelia coarctata]|nr:hypothetical protein [Trapelia coarctata]
MHWGRSWACAVTVLAAIGTGSANAILPRQDSSSSVQVSISASPAPSSTLTASSTQNGKSTQTPASTNPSQSHPTSTNPTTTRSPSTFTTSVMPSATVPGSVNITELLAAGEDDTKLPLTPTITPALSVAGVILIITGIVYAVIGIKNRWIQIFLSAAYLTSLCITVLIAYVMNPPISNAVQGAYFVGVCVPALILGGGSLIFQDITEGLGCIVGGFCVSMWILTLKAGGSITSTSGKAIFIGIFCVTYFALALSRHTRYYGLIGSTSFGGATVIVLGIDCFSQAGLKEFWLYIWALNGNLFPLLTVTYPITRGIRVEIAAIVVITLIGIMSQFKIWKVIQERRRKQLLEKKAEEQQRDQIEEEIGKRLVAGNGKEQEQWEAAYGDGTTTHRAQTDSGVGTEDNSIRKGSMSTVEATRSRGSQIHVIEMDALDRSGRSDPMQSDSRSGGPKVSVSPTGDSEGKEVVDRRLSQGQGGASGHNRTSSGSRTSPVQTAKYVDQWPKRTSSVIPKLLGPLPFETAVSNNDDTDDSSSVATFADSTAPDRRSMQRFSGASLFRKISKRSQRNSRQRPLSMEVASLANTRGDATLSTPPGSDRNSLEFPTPRSRHVRENSIGLSLRPQDILLPDSPDLAFQDSPKANAAGPAEDRTSKLMEEFTGQQDPFGASSPDENDNQRKSLLRPLSGVPEEAEHHHDMSHGPSAPSAEDHSFSGRLPEGGPKVASVFRTNEWAKHLDRAEKPEVDRIALHKPSDSQSSDSSEEAAAPVDMLALQTTALSHQSSRESFVPQPRSPESIPRNFLSEYMSQQQQQGPRSRTSTDSLSLKRKPVGSIPSPNPLSRKSSAQSDLSAPLNPNPTTANRPSILSLKLPSKTNARSSSSPIISPIVASPIEEGVETSFPQVPQQRYVSSPLAPTNTLLTQRASMLQNKHLSGISRNSSYTSVNGGGGLPASPSDPASLAIYSAPKAPAPRALEDDSLSLAQRRSILQSQSTRLLAPSSPSPYPPQPQPQPTYPLPSPHRASIDPSQRRASMLAAWHSSLATDLGSPQNQHLESEARRREMLEGKQRERDSKQEKQLRERGREKAWDEVMRRGDMLERHREALGRMQAEAREKLG